MNKAPAFQFYAADFLSDENVVLMNNREVGCYIKLLCFQWKQESVPDDINKIAKLCGEDSSAMAELWPSISPCFKPTDKTGRLANPRLESERIKQQNFRKERSEAGRKGAKKRWGNNNIDSSAITKPIAEPMANDSSSSSSSSSTSVKGVLSSDNTPSKTPQKQKPCPVKKIVELYHTTLPELSQVREPNSVAKNLTARWREKAERQSLDWWKNFFNTDIATSRYLMGNVNSFQVTLGWMVGPKNFGKIMNGHYVDRGRPSTGSKRTDNNLRVAEEFANE